jgi:hypothetical protein
MRSNDLEFFDELVAHDEPPQWESADEDLCVDETAPGSANQPGDDPYFFQPFDGAVVLRRGQPWHGGAYAEGCYYGSIGAAERAQRITVERAHVDALREDVVRRQLRALANWYLVGHNDVPSRALALEQISGAVRHVLGRSLSTGERQLLSSVLEQLVGESARYELTETGHQALTRSHESPPDPTGARRAG